MGEPAWSKVHALLPEYIGQVETTRGTETSKYPEERKSNETPRVAASESGPMPKPICALKLQGLAIWGLLGFYHAVSCRAARLYFKTREAERLGKAGRSG